MESINQKKIKPSEVGRTYGLILFATMPELVVQNRKNV